jgi:hypothetical protein
MRPKEMNNLPGSWHDLWHGQILIWPVVMN